MGDNWLLYQIHFLKDVFCDAWNNLKVCMHPLLFHGLGLKKDLLNWIRITTLLETQGGLDLGVF